ncbi:SDR family NAD(P)-dependent oxidoreductase [Miltoncostaea oceani]|uniref:SDR family NAD(P)-dependent oxidoreductase n=1 Tax=Miltoncostaea oceani TaxID=2843216 RepID=UPI001C3E379E|nr:SDR family oxidoreductase [Miltoncostaea oceani]
MSRVLVAGATGAIGGLVARELARRGADLAVTGRDAAALDALAADLGPSVALAVAADLTGDGEPDRVVAEAHAALGGLDAVVCAVGVVAFGPVAELDDATLTTLLQVNVAAPARLTRAAAAHMEKGGVIVNLSAIVADMPTAGMAAYSASKAALTAFDRAAGRELRRAGLRLVDVRPPHLATGLETRPIAGTAPRLPEGRDPSDWARRIADAVDDPGVTEVGPEA